ncbi:DUF3077 domain-containing protein [Pseudomonas reidholzensis]|uniref:hypothetical protein n=1 Tax=Pseudomonas reidholzensis TaxID=1785162 RepID=UPI0039EFBACE
MKKIVPDPPVSYISIISDLPSEDALAQARKMMVLLNQSLEVYLECEPGHRRDAMLENVSLLSQLASALVKHAEGKGVQP